MNKVLASMLAAAFLVGGAAMASAKTAPTPKPHVKATATPKPAPKGTKKPVVKPSPKATKKP